MRTRVSGGAEFYLISGEVPVPVGGVGFRLYAVAAYVEPDGRVEGHVLADEQVDEFVVEGGGVFGGAEVSVLHAPVANGFGHSRYQLAHTGFALVGADLSVKILRGDYVGRGHGPVFGNFDVLLLEDHAALGVGDLSVAEFPLYFGVGGDTGLGEEAAEGQALGLLLVDSRIAGSGLSVDLVAHLGHFLLLIR